MLVALSCCCSSRVSRLFVTCQPIVRHVSANRLSNAVRLFAERRTIVCRTPHDCLSNVEQSFVERRPMVLLLIAGAALVAVRRC